ncbi:MAG: M48 family metalloprotease [Verrucomicrobiota bacterium]|jgi:Zn-dependent protease with chaperone function
MDWNPILTLFCCLAAFAIGFAWNLLATWPGIRRLWRAAGGHWSERARILHPYRGAANVVASYLPVSLTLALQWVAFPPMGAVVAVACAGSAGAILGSFPISRAIDPTFSWSAWPVAFRFWQHPLLIVWAMVAAMPAKMGWMAWGAVALMVAWVAFVNLDPARFSMGHGRCVPTPPELEARARALAQEANAPFRGIHVVRKGSPNAWAFPVSGEIVVSEELVLRLTPAELDAILRHEMDHLREPLAMTLTRIVAAQANMVLLFTKPVVFAFGRPGLGAILLAWVLLPMGFARWSRRFEAKADSHAASVDSTAYATGLLKIHELGLIPAVIEGKTTHPHLYDRLLACGVKPDFDRPKPANVLTLGGILPSLAFGILVVVSLEQWLKAARLP